MKKLKENLGLIILAIVQNPIIGKSQNKFANGIFSTWNGKNVLRSKPLSVANPQTLPQQIQRAKISILAAVGKLYAPLSNVGLAIRPTGQSSRSYFNKLNFDFTSTSGTPPVGDFDFSNVLISQGGMTPTNVSSVTASNGSANVTIAFPSSAVDSSQSTTDKAYAAVYNKTEGSFGMSLGSVSRSSGTLTVAMPVANATNDELEITLFFKSSSSAVCSANTHISDTI
jgi:hypothetical protein